MGSLGFFAIGLADHLINLAPLPRLLSQLMVSALVWQAGLKGEEEIPLPGLGADGYGGWFWCRWSPYCG
jgi:UDP-N-acetylmuramyl pentapeptide phosphotransferase/UDP-N-acetylglucosamine-1-phosphate transferase